MGIIRRIGGVNTTTGTLIQRTNGVNITIGTVISRAGGVNTTVYTGDTNAPELTLDTVEEFETNLLIAYIVRTNGLDITLGEFRFGTVEADIPSLNPFNLANVGDNGFIRYTVDLVNRLPGTEYFFSVTIATSGGSSTITGSGTTTGTQQVDPTIQISTPVSISNTSFSPRAQVTDDGGSTVTSYGFEYGSTSALGSTITSTNIAANGTFSAQITGLTSNTTYFYRAFATNGTGNTVRTAITSDTTTAFIIRQPGDIITGITVNASGQVTVTTNSLGFVYYIGDLTTGGTSFTANTNSATASVYPLVDRNTSRSPNIGIQVSDATANNNGSQLSIRTISPETQSPSLPNVTINEATLTTSSGELAGTINATGAAATSANFYYLIDDTTRDASYLIANGTQVAASGVSGVVGASITYGTSLALRDIQILLVATNSSGSSDHGVNTQSIPSITVSPLTVTTSAVSMISTTSAYFTGVYVLGNGGSIVNPNGTAFLFGTDQAQVEMGVVSRTGAAVGTGVSRVTGDKLNPTFNATIVSLTPETTYYVAALAQDQIGWHADRSAVSFATGAAAVVNGTASYGDVVETTEGGITTDQTEVIVSRSPLASERPAGVMFQQTVMFRVPTITSAEFEDDTFTCEEDTEESGGGSAGTCVVPTGATSPAAGTVQAIGAFYLVRTLVASPSSSDGTVVSRFETATGTSVTPTFGFTISPRSSGFGLYELTEITGTATGAISNYNWSVDGQVSPSSGSGETFTTSSGPSGLKTITCTATREGVVTTETTMTFIS